jgi:hypothetical protein
MVPSFTQRERPVIAPILAGMITQQRANGYTKAQSAVIGAVKCGDTGFLQAQTKVRRASQYITAPATA